MWGVVESASNLTPRGLQNIFSSSVDNYFVHSLDSFLLSNRPQDDQTEFNYMLFVWNGKNTNALVKVANPPFSFFSLVRHSPSLKATSSTTSSRLARTPF